MANGNIPTPSSYAPLGERVGDTYSSIPQYSDLSRESDLGVRMQSPFDFFPPWSPLDASNWENSPANWSRNVRTALDNNAAIRSGASDQVPMPFGIDTTNPTADANIRGLLGFHKLQHTVSQALPGVNVPDYSYNLEGLTDWGEDPTLLGLPKDTVLNDSQTAAIHNSALHAAYATGNPFQQALLAGYNALDRGNEDNQLAKWRSEDYWAAKPRPLLEIARPMGFEQGYQYDDDALRDVFAEERGTDLFKMGITDVQGMLDKGIARPETPHFNWGRNLPNETRRPVAPDNTYQSFGNIKPISPDPRMGMGPEDLYPNDYSNQQLYNRATSRLQNFLKPGVDPLVPALQPSNTGQTHTGTLRSFLPPVTFPEGSVAPFQGQEIDWNLPPPSREDWNEADAFTVTDRAEASLYPIGTTTGSLLEEPSTENLNTIDWRTILGIDPNVDRPWQEVLGMQPGPGGPVRPAYNRDEFGNVASLARFTEPEVDTDDFIINNLIDSMSRVGQPGPGGPAKPQPEQDDSSNARQAREADERARANREKERERAVTPPKTKTKTKAKTKLVPRVSEEEIFEARHKDLMDLLNEGYSRAGRAVLPPSHMLYDI